MNIEELENWEDYYPEDDSVLDNKIHGFENNSFNPGDKFILVYKDDIDWLKTEFEIDFNPNEISKQALNNFTFSEGVLIPMRNREKRGIFDIIEDGIMVIYDYPCEKCYPEVDYVNACKVLGFDDLVYLIKI